MIRRAVLVTLRVVLHSVLRRLSFKHPRSTCCSVRLLTVLRRSDFSFVNISVCITLINRGLISQQRLTGGVAFKEANNTARCRGGESMRTLPQWYVAPLRGPLGRKEPMICHGPLLLVLSSPAQLFRSLDPHKLSSRLVQWL